ncbi:Protein of unknown function [Bacteroidales bacterium KHT7]|nr:Protein of unknown function [Bacteroidales bacterium KHT7]
MKRKLFFISAAMLTVCTPAFAQNEVVQQAEQTEQNVQETRVSASEQIQSVLKNYQDTLSSTIYKFRTGSDTDAFNTRMNPYGYKMFVPYTFYKSPVTQQMSLNSDSGNEKHTQVMAFANKHLLNTYMHFPDNFATTENELKDVKVNLGEVKKRNIKVSKLIDSDASSDVGKDNALVKKPNFWKYTGNVSLQFTQSYISGNWYQGGTSSNSMLSNFKATAVYDDQQRISFDNALELKLGFIQQEGDTIHKYKTNSDQFRLTSKLGYKTAEKSDWYYTLQLEAYSQFCSGYKTNDLKRYSSFLSPGKLAFSLGIDYKKTGKKGEVSVLLSPATYNFTCVTDSLVDETSYGLKEGNKILHDFGYKVQVTYKYVFCKQISMEGRFYVFSNYHKLEGELEHTFNFQVGKWLSTKLYFYPRFDDNRTRVEGYNYWQMKEMLSFGLNYTL